MLSKLTQEQNEGTSHSPVVPSPSTVQNRNLTQRHLRTTRAGVKLCHLTPGTFGGKMRRLKMFKGMRILILILKRLKIKFTQNLQKARGIHSAAAYVWFRCESVIARATLSNSALNSCVSFALRCFCCVSPSRNFSKGRVFPFFIFFPQDTTDVQ